jgi:transcriptional regulator with XRE-family HTH domain
MHARITIGGMTEQWWPYLQRISGNASQKDIAEAAGVDPGSVSRWKLGRVAASPESAINVARYYGRSPIEALTICGFLRSEECLQAVELAPPLSAVTDDALLGELAARLGGRRASVQA